MRSKLSINTEKGIYELNGIPINDSLICCNINIKHGKSTAELELIADVDITTNAIVKVEKI